MSAHAADSSHSKSENNFPLALLVTDAIAKSGANLYLLDIGKG